MEQVFIEATMSGIGKRTLVNVSEIAQVIECPNPGVTKVYMKGSSDDNGVLLDMSYDRVVSIIKSVF